MADSNIELMKLFPSPDELPAHIRRDQALPLIRRVLEASRAAIDEIGERSDRVLTENEQIVLGQLGEKLADYAETAISYGE